MQAKNILDLESRKKYLKSIEEELNELSFLGKEEMLNHLLNLGKDIPTYPSTKCSQNLVQGCQSQVYLFIEKKASQLYLSGSSDSLILKGFLHILFTSFSGLNCQEFSLFYEEFKQFLTRSSLPQSLTTNRSMGLKYILDFSFSLKESVC